MNLLIESLQEEYKNLRVRMDKVADLLITYGGEIPGASENPAPTTIVAQYKHTIKGQDYPSGGTWKEKILFVLNAKGEPMFAKDIAKAIEALEGFILAREVKLNTDHILKTVTQYTSAMGKSGEIGVDTTGFRNQYFIIKK